MIRVNDSYVGNVVKNVFTQNILWHDIDTQIILYDYVRQYPDVAWVFLSKNTQFSVMKNVRINYILRKKV